MIFKMGFYTLYYGVFGSEPFILKAHCHTFLQVYKWIPINAHPSMCKASIRKKLIALHLPKRRDRLCIEPYPKQGVHT